MLKDKLLNEFESLPPEAQRQVIDFIAFLQTRYQSDADTKKRAAPRVNFRDEAFVGMWRDREDMKNSSQWVRNIRTPEWK